MAQDRKSEISGNNPDGSMHDRNPTGVPPLLDRLAALSWRVLLVGAVAAAAGIVLVKLTVILVPVFVALMLVTLLMPLLHWLRRRGLSRSIATVSIVLAALLIAAGLSAVVVPTAITQAPRLESYLSDAVTSIQTWMTDGPLGISAEKMEEYTARVTSLIRDNSSAISSRVVGGALAGIYIFVGIALTAMLTVYFLLDGDRINAGLLGLVDAQRRGAVRALAEHAWRAYSRYIRGMVTMSTIDTAVIGVVLFVARVPSAIPLMLLVFVVGFLPVLGWVVATVVIALVTLASGGLVKAGIVVLVIALFYFIEGNVLTPKIIGKAASLHPVVTLLVFTAGGTLGGIIGAFFAVPATAVLVAVIKETRSRQTALAGAQSTHQDVSPSSTPG